jgi:hypothetical protein
LANVNCWGQLATLLEDCEVTSLGAQPEGPELAGWSATDHAGFISCDAMTCADFLLNVVPGRGNRQFLSADTRHLDILAGLEFPTTITAAVILDNTDGFTFASALENN